MREKSPLEAKGRTFIRGVGRSTANDGAPLLLWFALHVLYTYQV